MTPTLFHAVARRADALTPDADLLSRYVHSRGDAGANARGRPDGEAAFEELVRRHGPLVWAVCRQMLPHHADAEDAFQAVFLALARCGTTIRDGRAVPAWLHGVAVRVATRARRAFARRRARERAAALGEAGRPVSGAAWDALAAAVHEEVQRLPDPERAAFVLCDLQGVSQPDAAVRLGWPLGSVSGRLCKARQYLLNRLTARGIAPAAVVGIGLTAGSAGAVPVGLVGTPPRGFPPALLDAVKTFPHSPTAASTVVATLARGLTEGATMRVKVMAAAAVLVAAVGLTGTAVVFSTAEAQQPAGGGGAVTLPRGGQPTDPSRTGPPGMAPPPPAGNPVGGGMPGPGRGAAEWLSYFAPATWEYKFVDVKSDRKEFEKAIAMHGKDGWEFCASERFPEGDKAGLVLVFKKRKGGDAPFGGMGGGGGGGMGGGWGTWHGEGGAKKDDPTTKVFPLKYIKAADAANALTDILAGSGLKFTADPKGAAFTVSGDLAALKKFTASIEKIIEDAEAKAAAKPAAFLNIMNLKNAQAGEMVTVLKPLFPKADMTADPRTNAVIVRGDQQTLDDIRMLVARLDSVETPKGK
jgi:RNA polymerase sigma factor (sigma-70 family)